MPYDPKAVREAYDHVAEEEDRAEKELSLRTEIPREFIKRYLQASDVVLDAGGGGYILEPGITIQADVPLANILAVIEAVETQAGLSKGTRL